MTERKMIKVMWMPERDADKSEYEHIREECFEFKVPEEFIYSIAHNKRLKVGEDLELEYKFGYICSHCGQDLVHMSSGVYAPFQATAGLECKCGSWEGKASPFSGSWYGGKVTYQKFTEEEKRERIKREVERLLALHGLKLDYLEKIKGSESK